ncbi:MAG: hypothetical protein J0L73_13960 [Verrucomicrobia bacterium]|nr:hypothetical protein [Verrucomicrobiota bacterium]
MNRMLKRLMMCGLLLLGFVPGRSLGARPYAKTYHEWHMECGRAWVRITESDRLEDGMFQQKVVPGRQVNFRAGPVYFSIPCSLSQMGAGLLLLVGLGIVGEEWWRRGRKGEET